MPGYLEGYGAGEERRERILKRSLLAVLAVLVAGVGLYFTFRNYRELKQAKLFLHLLRGKDYQTAYRLWGCAEPGAQACQDYPFDRFVEDWGPQSAHANVAAAEIKKVRGCPTGVIVTVQFGPEQEEFLWVERKDRFIGFAPWPVCNPRYRPPE